MWLSELEGSHIVRIDRATGDVTSRIEVPVQPGLVIPDADGSVWMEVGGPPAGLLPVDADAQSVGSIVALDTGGEVVGSTFAFGSIWLPLYDDATLVRADTDGTELERIEVGLGPLYVREGAGALWLSNGLEGTVQRIDPGTNEVVTIDLEVDADAIDRPSGIVTDGNAIIVRAERVSDRRIILYRLDPVTGDVLGRRTVPGGLASTSGGGMAIAGGTLFVLDRPQQRLIGLDLHQFLDDDPDLPAPSDAGSTPEQEAIEFAIRELLARDTDETAMADGIVDGDQLATQIAAFKQFFVDNLPGEPYEGLVLNSVIDDDVADIEFVVAVAGQPIVDPVAGRVELSDGTWKLAPESFCALVATGGIDCPRDLTGEP